MSSGPPWVYHHKLRVFNLLKMSSFTLSFMCRVATSQKIIYAHGHVCDFYYHLPFHPSPLQRCATWPLLSLDSTVLLFYTASPDEMLRMSPGTARKVPLLSPYAPDFKFPPSQARFTPPSGYTQPLWLKT